MTCSAFWHRAAVPLLPLESPWYVDVIKPKIPHRQFQRLGPSASFDNTLNKLQLKKLKMKAWMCPWCLRWMYLGCRAGSHSPPIHISCQFCPDGSQFLCSACLFLRVGPRFFPAVDLYDWTCFQWAWGAKAVQRGPVGHSWINQFRSLPFPTQSPGCGHQDRDFLWAPNRKRPATLHYLAICIFASPSSLG